MGDFCAPPRPGEARARRAAPENSRRRRLARLMLVGIYDPIRICVCGKSAGLRNFGPARLFNHATCPLWIPL